MTPTRTIWTVIAGTSLITGYRALRDGHDPIPQIAAIGTAGVILLFVAGPLPKVASGLSVLIGISFVFNLDLVENANRRRISGGGNRIQPADTPVSGPR